MEKEMKARIVHKHDIEANWLKASGFVPKQGEIIVYDKDSNCPYERIKIGDGISNVNILPFTHDAYSAVTPQDYGAKGDGSTDDTAAFQTALAKHRCVYVPGGIYKLSKDLLIRDNCELELAQDAVLEFTQTSGNCISMKYSAHICGHHATIRVPYGFTGNVIYVSSTLDTNVLETPPFTKWDPQWKAGRYITDLNIVMPDTRGFHYCMNPGDCSGTAVYMSADGSSSIDTQSSFIWGLNFSGLRIAGAFEYGIRAQNFNDGWNHEMRIEAVIESCEIGASLEDCNNAFISVVMQPRPGLTEDANSFVYAKHGIQLIRSRNTDLSGSRIWDWDASRTLWERNGVYQHIAMYGDCRGTILSDFYYYEVSGDVREYIYTDTPSNLEKITILQEPFTKWFKPIDNEPYFNNGLDGDQRLLLKSEQDALFQTKRIPNFNNLLPLATDDDGEVYNGIGYKIDTAINGLDGSEFQDGLVVSTGYIPCTATSVLYFSGVKWNTYGYCGIHLYNAQKEHILFYSAKNAMADDAYHYKYSETDDGFKLVVNNTPAQQSAAYFRICFYKDGFGSKPAIAVDEEISYSQNGFLADGIFVSADYIHGIDTRYINVNQKVVEITDASTDEQYPTAKAVYDLVNGAFGEYVTDIAALVGGDA